MTYVVDTCLTNTLTSSYCSQIISKCTSASNSCAGSNITDFACFRISPVNLCLDQYRCGASIQDVNVCVDINQASEMIKRLGGNVCNASNAQTINSWWNSSPAKKRAGLLTENAVYINNSSLNDNCYYLDTDSDVECCFDDQLWYGLMNQYMNKDCPHLHFINYEIYFTLFSNASPRKCSTYSFGCNYNCGRFTSFDTTGGWHSTENDTIFDAPVARVKLTSSYIDFLRGCTLSCTFSNLFQCNGIKCCTYNRQDYALGFTTRGCDGNAYKCNYGYGALNLVITKFSICGCNIAPGCNCERLLFEYFPFYCKTMSLDTRRSYAENGVVFLGGCNCYVYGQQFVSTVRKNADFNYMLRVTECGTFNNIGISTNCAIDTLGIGISDANWVIPIMSWTYYPAAHRDTFVYMNHPQNIAGYGGFRYIRSTTQYTTGFKSSYNAPFISTMGFDVYGRNSDGELYPMGPSVFLPNRGRWVITDRYRIPDSEPTFLNLKRYGGYMWDNPTESCSSTSTIPDLILSGDESYSCVCGNISTFAVLNGKVVKLNDRFRLNMCNSIRFMGTVDCYRVWSGNVNCNSEKIPIVRCHYVSMC